MRPIWISLFLVLALGSLQAIHCDIITNVFKIKGWCEWTSPVDQCVLLECPFDKSKTKIKPVLTPDQQKYVCVETEKTRQSTVKPAQENYTHFVRTSTGDLIAVRSVKMQERSCLCETSFAKMVFEENRCKTNSIEYKCELCEPSAALYTARSFSSPKYNILPVCAESIATSNLMYKLIGGIFGALMGFSILVCFVRIFCNFSSDDSSSCMSRCVRAITGSGGGVRQSSVSRRSQTAESLDYLETSSYQAGLDVAVIQDLIIQAELGQSHAQGDVTSEFTLPAIRPKPPSYYEALSSSYFNNVNIPKPAVGIVTPSTSSSSSRTNRGNRERGQLETGTVTANEHETDEQLPSYNEVIEMSRREEQSTAVQPGESEPTAVPEDNSTSEAASLLVENEHSPGPAVIEESAVETVESSDCPPAYNAETDPVVQVLNNNTAHASPGTFDDSDIV